MTQKNTFLLLSFALLLSLPAHAGSPELIGDAQGDQVELMWRLDAWPVGLDGFEMHRRAVPGGSWEPLHSRLIAPSIDAEVDLVEVEPDFRKRREVTDKLRAEIAGGEMAPASRREMIQAFQAEPAALGLLGIYLIGNFDLALAVGFGFADRYVAPSPTGTWDYGLFAVRKGVVDARPSSIFRWVQGDQVDPNLAMHVETVRVAQESLAVRWAFDPQELKKHRIAGFRVYRQEGGAFKPIGPDDFILAPTDGQGMGAFIDEGRNVEVSATYAVAPINSFGREGRKSSTVWAPKSAAVAVAAPRIVGADLVQGGAETVLTWEVDPSMESDLVSFTVTRKGAANRVVELGPDERSFIDRQKRPADEWYSYTVTAHIADGSNSSSTPAAVFLPLIHTPPSPQDFRGRTVMRNGELHILLEWAAPKASDQITDGYVLYANSPPNQRMWRQASLGTIRGHSIEVPVYTADSATYRFQLAAKSAGHDESPKTSVLEVRTGATSLPLITISGIKSQDDRMLVTWNYEQIPDLAGFRVYLNDALVADTDTLGAAARSWTSRPLNGAQKIEVEAVSTFGVTERSFAGHHKLTRSP